MSIANVDTFVTTSGPPRHVRLSFANRGARTSSVRIERIDHLKFGARRPLEVTDVDWGEKRPDGSKPFALAPGRTLQVVAFVSGDLPADDSKYTFVVTVLVDGIPQDVVADVSRATRFPQLPP